MASISLPGRRRRAARHRRVNPRLILAVGVLLLLFVAAMLGYLAGQAGTDHAASVPVPAAGRAPGTNHTKAGAASAAAADLERLYGPDFVYPQTREAALKAIADPAQLRTLKAQLDGQIQQFNDATHFDSIVSSGTPAVSVLRVLTPPEVTGYNGSTAQARMWVMDILGTAGGVPPRVGWNIATVNVRYVAGSWRVDAITLETGPAPASDLDTDPPTDASAFVAEVHQLQGVSK